MISPATSLAIDWTCLAVTISIGAARLYIQFTRAKRREISHYDTELILILVFVLGLASVGANTSKNIKLIKLGNSPYIDSESEEIMTRKVLTFLPVPLENPLPSYAIIIPKLVLTSYSVPLRPKLHLLHNDLAHQNRLLNHLLPFPRHHPSNSKTHPLPPHPLRNPHLHHRNPSDAPNLPPAFSRLVYRSGLLFPPTKNLVPLQDGSSKHPNRCCLNGTFHCNIKGPTLRSKGTLGSYYIFVYLSDTDFRGGA